MRIMVEPRFIDKAQYARLVDAFVASERWTVVDRRDGFESIRQEQQREHGALEAGDSNNPDRFQDNQKWAQWGKFWGVGAVAVAYPDCYLKVKRNIPLFGKRQLYKRCDQFISLVDTNTGEVLASGRATEDGSGIAIEEIQKALKSTNSSKLSTWADGLSGEEVTWSLNSSSMLKGMDDLVHIPEPEWVDVVENLTDTYPATFDLREQHPFLIQYQEESGAKARELKRHREFKE